MDYYVWSFIKRVNNKLRDPNVTSFQAAIETAFANMDKNASQRTCQRFRTKIEVVIKAKRDYIE